MQSLRCAGCGYDLRGSGSLSVVCPECGLQSRTASRTGVAGAWIVLAIFISVTAILLFLLIVAVSNYQYLESNRVLKFLWGGGGPVFRPVDVRVEYRVFFAVALAVPSLLIGLAVALVLHHRSALANLLPFLIGLAVCHGVVLAVATFRLPSAMLPSAFPWCATFLAWNLLAHAACYAAGVLGGRPLFRRLAVWFLPPAIRNHVAYLWYVDGKAMPIDDRLPEKDEAG